MTNFPGTVGDGLTTTLNEVSGAVGKYGVSAASKIFDAVDTAISATDVYRAVNDPKAPPGTVSQQVGGLIVGGFVGGIVGLVTKPLGPVRSGVAAAVAGNEAEAWIEEVARPRTPKEVKEADRLRDLANEQTKLAGRLLESGYDPEKIQDAVLNPRLGPDPFRSPHPADNPKAPPFAIAGAGRGTVNPTSSYKNDPRSPAYNPSLGPNPFKSPNPVDDMRGNGFDGPGSAGKIPSHLTGTKVSGPTTKSSSGGSSSDAGGGLYGSDFGSGYQGSGGQSSGSGNGSYISNSSSTKTTVSTGGGSNNWGSSGGTQARDTPTSPTKTTAPTKTTSSSGGGSNNWGSTGGTQARDISSSATVKTSGYDKVGTPNRGSTSSGVRGPRPIVLDLDNDGIEITELSRSTTFMDADGDGLVQRTAWAGAGDGVLFYDAGNDGLITESREYVFTEWDPTATSDLKALKAAFDTNGDGKLTAADAEFAKFKVMVTNADGTQTAKTLAELGITELNLNAAVALVTLPDGSQITAANDNRQNLVDAA
jgi:hypothetical protein